MALASGTRLGPYEIVSALGAGGMGEVYRANDTRLSRQVAVKVLPEALARDGNRLARFEQEARALAALNHPNLLAIFDVGNADGVQYLVSELLEGETLRQRLQKGAIPQRKLVEYSTRIAQGLAAAHEKGIVHRDLKPENVFLTKDEQVKILDFGLAKYASDALGEANVLAAGPEVTASGMVMGTAGYMSPEQVRGQAADSRSDIFSFGAMLYEMACGRRAFRGDTAVETMHAILKSDPPEISAGAGCVTPGLERIIRHCLERNAADRFQSARDLAFALGELAGTGATATLTQPPKRIFADVWKWAAAAAAVLTLVLAAGYWGSRERVAAPEVRSVLPPPSDVTVLIMGDDGSVPVLSPDGSKLVFRGTTGGKRMLYLRPMNGGQAKPVPGTDDGLFPFWSPDGKSLGFFADKELKRVDIGGGPPTSLAHADYPRGGAWAGNNILYVPSLYDTIWRVPASGGTAQRATTVDRALHTTHRWPQFLADGKHFVYLAQNHLGGKEEAGGIYSASLDGGPAKFIVRSNGMAIYASGYLLYYRDGSLVAQELDEQKMELKGDATVIGQVLRETGNFEVFATASSNGILLYQSAGEVKYPVEWFDERGQREATAPFTGPLKTLRLSPDGTRAAIVGFEGPAGTLATINLTSRARTKLSFGENAWFVAWSPDGRQVAYSAQKPESEDTEIYVKPSDGSGERRTLLSDGHLDNPTDWTRDGNFLVLNRGRAGARQVWLMPLHDDGKLAPLFKDAQYDHHDGRVSPDGKWIAYLSSEFSSGDLFVTSFPEGRGKWQVSAPGGAMAAPVWSGDGKTLYYVSSAGDLMEARLQASGSSMSVQGVQPLFRSPFLATTLYSLFDVDSNGRRRFFGSVAPDANALPVNVVTNWTAPLRKK